MVVKLQLQCCQTGGCYINVYKSKLFTFTLYVTRTHSEKTHSSTDFSPAVVTVSALPVTCFISAVDAVVLTRFGSLIHPSLSGQKHGIHLLLFSLYSPVLPLTLPAVCPPTHPPCPKSSEGHPGAQEVDVMSANEPIDSLSTG